MGPGASRRPQSWVIGARHLSIQAGGPSLASSLLIERWRLVTVGRRVQAAHRFDDTKRFAKFAKRFVKEE